MTFNEQIAQLDVMTTEGMNQLWILEGYKLSKELGDTRKKDLEDCIKNNKRIAPEIPIEEVD